MSRKNLYLIILISAIVFAVVGRFYIKPVAVSLGLMKGMLDEWPIWVSAVICAFVCSKFKYYWLSIAICALVFSLAVQAFYLSLNAGAFTICVRALLFVAIVFVIDYMRLIFKR